MEDEKFIKEFEKIKTFIEPVQGIWGFNEKNLRMLCQGFYLIGKGEAMSEATEALDKLPY